MARGGFIAPIVYLKNAFDRNVGLENAKRAVVEALRLRKLDCRGRRTESALERLGLMIEGPRNEAQRPKRAVQQLIPPDLMARTSDATIAEWDWETGEFVTSGQLGARQLWEDVKLNERQCNELLDRLDPRVHPASQETLRPADERRRGPAWDEWVSVVTTLAYEHAIDASSTDRDILDRAAARLGIRHEPEKQSKRMKSAALAIVSRWKIAPPKEPAPIKHVFSTPTPKP
jgi:hypothetical protein